VSSVVFVSPFFLLRRIVSFFSPASFSVLRGKTGCSLLFPGLRRFSPMFFDFFWSRTDSFFNSPPHRVWRSGNVHWPLAGLSLFLIFEKPRHSLRLPGPFAPNVVAWGGLGGGDPPRVRGSVFVLKAPFRPSPPRNFDMGTTHLPFSCPLLTRNNPLVFSTNSRATPKQN